jgi:class 3 adenylate cyclase
LRQAGGVGGTGEHRPEALVSDAERDQVVALIAKYCGEGRLTLDEFTQRVEVVLAARTRAQLDEVLSDLPSAPALPRVVPTSSHVVAVFGGASRRGRWRPGARLRATAVFGGVDLDLRSAELQGSEIEVRAVALFGGVDIVVPEGVAVELSGLSVFGGKEARVADVPVIPGSPVVKVRGFPIFGGVTVRSKRSAWRMLDRTRPPELGDRRRLDVREALALADEVLDLLDGVFAKRRGARLGQSRSRPRLAPDGTVTIVFSDVSGFTELTERLGDHAAQQLLATYFQIVRGHIATHGGSEVKCHGDEVMVAFADPGQAVRCAVEIQRSLRRYNERAEGDPLRVHIGMHSGEAIQEQGDFLGRTVIVASRITDEARADEILVSTAVHDATASSADLTFGQGRAVELQGVSGSQLLYPVTWE